MSKKTYKIPFSKHDGHLISYDPGIDNDNIEWRDNYEFEDSLTYIGYIGGRSSMSMKVRSIRTGIDYTMFFTYFDDCIRRSDNTTGPTFHGRWTFIKTGQNYSIKPV